MALSVFAAVAEKLEMILLLIFNKAVPVLTESKIPSNLPTVPPPMMDIDVIIFLE